MQKTTIFVKGSSTMFFPRVYVTREEAEALHQYGQITLSWLKLVIANYDQFAEIFDAKRLMTAKEGYARLLEKWTAKANEVMSHLHAFSEGKMDLIDMVFMYCVGYKQCRRFVADVLRAADMIADVDELWKRHKKYAQRDTTMALYGVEHTALRDEVQSKRKATNRERYGADNPMQNKQIREKLREQIQMFYGVEYAFQTKTAVGAWQKKVFDILTTDSTWREILQEKAGDRFGPDMFGKILPLNRRDFVISELSNTHVEDLIRLWNKKTGSQMRYPDNQLFQLPFAFSKTWLRYYDKLGILTVPEHYYEINASIYEKHVAELLDSLGIEYKVNVKKELDGLEMDFYIPEKHIGIEVNPNVSHNSNLYALLPTRCMFTSRKDPAYHYIKYCKAKAVGITLIQLFGNDLEPTVFQNVTAKRLKFLLMGPVRKIGARTVTVRRLVSIKEEKQARDFLAMHHSQGAARASEYWAFEQNGEWLGVASFAGSDEIELKRLCFLPGIQIMGGLSKLIAEYFKVHSECQLIYSYSDNNLGSGEAYRKAGAQFIRESGPALKFISPKDGRDHYSWQIATSWGASNGVVGKDADGKGLKKPETTDEINEYIETKLSHRYDDGYGYDRVYTAGSKLWHFVR